MKDRKELLYVSIVVITYNEEKKIELTLKSLLNQNYPKKNYEIIVVDDCSRDNTVDIIKKFPVKLIKHKKNLGRAQARNTGLKYAKGEIYISFDGDCVADRNWLKEIIKIYKTKKDIGGVSGLIVEKNNANLIEKFIQESGCGNPKIKSSIKSDSLLSKSFSYIKEKFSYVNERFNRKVFEISMMSGANSSFQRKFILGVKGYDKHLNAGEDTDLVNRIKKKYPDSKLYCNPKALIVHNHRMSLIDYLLRPWRRRKDIIIMHLREKKRLPFFPMATLFLLFSLIFSIVNWRIFIINLIFLPQLLYFWFPLKYLKSFKTSFLLFPYLLLINEIIEIFSIFIGYIEVKLER